MGSRFPVTGLQVLDWDDYLVVVWSTAGIGRLVLAPDCAEGHKIGVRDGAMGTQRGVWTKSIPQQSVA